MKLYTIAWQNRPLVCLENRPGRLTPLPYETMNHLLADRPDHRAGVLEKAGKGSGEFALAEVQVLAPIPHPRQDVICRGMNYQKHKTEAERFDAAAFTREKAQAVYFSKRATHCPGPGAPIPGHFDLVDSLDYETELAVLLGRDAKNVTEADGFTPMGPCIVTKEAFPQPPAQAIRTWVNGQLRQEAVTDQLIFSIPHILRELSQGMTLQAGTIIATGTPAGVGMGFDPPRFLRAGDVVRCEIEGIGVLENTVEG